MNTRTRGEPAIDAIIERSLLRSASYGIDPHCTGAPEESRINTHELNARIKAQKQFYDLGKAQMNSLYKLLRGTGFCMALADAEGYVLHVIGDRELLEHFRKRRCSPGYRWREQDIGTCAIGLALVEKIPIFLPGEMMYSVPAQKLSNAGAPVFSPSGHLLGAISLSGYSNKMHIHTLGLVRQAAETITSQWSEAEKLAELATKNQYLRALIDSDPRGIITIDREGKIVKTNQTANTLLNLPAACQDKPLSECAGAFSEVIKLMNDGKSFVGREFQVQKNSRVLFASLAPIRVEGALVGGLITVQEKKEVLRHAVRITGMIPQFTFSSICGQSAPIKAALHLAKIAATNDAAVLLEGETGTGKELFAQAIHNAGKRRNGPFVAINCGAIPRELLESELFGYTSGAFTGAQKGGRPGKIELADNGTLFLDEIGDLPLDMQVKLLRALQFGEIQRLGSLAPLNVNIRVISATSVDMSNAISIGAFRPDLFYRVSTLRISIPPLRERGQDILELANHFIHRLEAHLGAPHRNLSDEAIKVLLNYDWPGNIRQLENAIERAIYLSEGEEFLPSHFGFKNEGFSSRHRVGTDSFVSNSQGFSATENINAMERSETLKEAEKKCIVAALRKSKGNISECSKILGTSRPTLYRKIQEHNIQI